MVHRDVKPGNLILDQEGTLKILDLGLARIDETDSRSESAQEEQLTDSETVMGTYHYMAPEQAEDPHRADHRADIYALGCTLHWLLAAKPPFERDTRMKVLLAHHEWPVPSLGAARSDVPRDLDEIFRRMLAKRPEDRYQSMKEIVEVLESQVGIDELAIRSDLAFRVKGLSKADASADSQPDETPKAGVRRDVGQRVRRRHRATPIPFRWSTRTKLAALASAAIFLVTLGVWFVVVWRKGTVTIIVNEPGVSVRILDERDNLVHVKTSGKGPIEIRLGPGRYRVKIKKDGFLERSAEFVIKSRERETVREPTFATCNLVELGKQRLGTESFKKFGIEVATVWYAPTAMLKGPTVFEDRLYLGGWWSGGVYCSDEQGQLWTRVFSGLKCSDSGQVFSHDGHLYWVFHQRQTEAKLVRTKDGQAMEAIPLPDDVLCITDIIELNGTLYLAARVGTPSDPRAAVLASNNGLDWGCVFRSSEFGGVDQFFRMGDALVASVHPIGFENQRQKRGGALLTSTDGSNWSETYSCESRSPPDSRRIRQQDLHHRARHAQPVRRPCDVGKGPPHH